MNKKIDRTKEDYQKRVLRRNIIILSIGASLLIICFLVSMNTGFIHLSPVDTIRTIFGGGTEKENLTLFSFRLPRILISIMVGSGLAIAGCIIQGITKNPLADTGIMGINSGAGLMVVLNIILIGSNSFLSVFTLPFVAFIGAGVTAILVYLLAYKSGEGVTPLRLVLTGVSLQAGISALMTVLVVRLDETQYNFIASWQAGSIWGSNWKFLITLLPWFLVLIPYVLYKARILDIMNLDTITASGLGINTKKELRKLLVAATALAASCVAVSGNISFVGLIIPHLARRLVGPRHSILLPTCMLLGGVLVLSADTIARVIIQPSKIPAGIVVAVLGAPYFLYLLAKKKY